MRTGAGRRVAAAGTPGTSLSTKNTLPRLRRRGGSFCQGLDSKHRATRSSPRPWEQRAGGVRALPAGCQASGGAARVAVPALGWLSAGRACSPARLLFKPSGFCNLPAVSAELKFLFLSRRGAGI